jgi:hypothetical protein
MSKNKQLDLQQLIDDFSQSKLAKRSDEQLQRDLNLKHNRTFTAEGREAIRNTHKGRTKSKLADQRAKEAYAKRNEERYNETKMLALAKNYKSLAEFEDENGAAIKYIRKQPWYPKFKEILGVTNSWTEGKAITFLKQFESRAAAWKDKQGQQAILFLQRNNLNHIQSKIWSNFKPGRGYTQNEKLTNKQLTTKIKALVKQLKTSNYTRIAKELRTLGIGASDRKVRDIVQSL